MSTTYSLESQFYTDPEIFARERERIFKPNWWLLSPAHLCVAPGQYVSDTVCGWPVFVIRGKDGALRGFHNVCRHRGAELLPAGEGQCNVIKCPYHAWGYAQEGKLIAAPGFNMQGEQNQLDFDAMSLLSIRVSEWRGMIFVSMDESGPEFMDWVGTLDSLMSDFPGCESMSYHGRFDVTGQANWKTYCDNTVEGYHLPSVHPRLATAVNKGSVDIKSYDGGELVAFHVDYGGDDSSLRGNQGLWTYRYPGFQIAISANAFKVERVEATSVDSVRSINWAWYNNLSAEAVEDSFAWSEKVVEEDLGICEKVQLNMGNGVYEKGPLSPLQEQHVAGFQAVVRAALTQLP